MTVPYFTLFSRHYPGSYPFVWPGDAAPEAKSVGVHYGTQLLVVPVYIRIDNAATHALYHYTALVSHPSGGGNYGFWKSWTMFAFEAN